MSRFESSDFRWPRVIAVVTVLALAGLSVAQMPGGALPAGHPEMTKSPATRPAADAPAMLPGHPDFSGVTALTGAATEPAAAPKSEGSLLIRVRQGTKGGPPIGPLPIHVDLQSGREMLEPIQASLGPTGSLHITGMPVDKPLLSRVRLEYAGVEYSKDAPQVDAMHADQVVDLTVYETTETDPNLQVQMQHLNVAPGDGGLRVELMLAVQNPVDRAWIGKPGLDGSRATIALPLPIDAKNVQLSGDFHACCARIQPGRVTELQGVLPGVSEFRVGYTMPIKNGAADLAIKTIAPVQNFVMFMPAGLKTANVVGVEPMDASAMGAKDMQFFNAKDLPAGQDVKMSIAGIPQTRAGTGGMAGRAGSAASSSDDTARIALYVAGGGAAMIVMLGGAFIALKTSKARKRAA